MVDQTKVHVLDLEVAVRRGGSGDPLLVLHRDTGPTGWSELHETLSRHFNVIAPDLPGFGASSVPAWMRSVHELATVIGFVVDEVAPSGCSVLGLGFGGWVAAEAAVLDRSRFSRIVLHAPFGVRPPNGDFLDQFLWNTKDYVKLGFADGARYDEIFGAQVPEDIMEGWERSREMSTRIAWRPYMYSQALPHFLKAVKAPTLIVGSARDAIVPSSVAERYAELIPGARSVLLEGTGHQVDLESPSLLADAVTLFLRDGRSSASVNTGLAGSGARS